MLRVFEALRGVANYIHLLGMRPHILYALAEQVLVIFFP